MAYTELGKLIFVTLTLTLNLYPELCTLFFTAEAE